MIKKLFFTIFISLVLSISAWAASISTLTDNFNDNSIDGTKWGTALAGGGSVAETNQRLELSVTAVPGSYVVVYSIATYNLTGSQATIKLVNAGNQTDPDFVVYPLLLYKDDTHQLDWAVCGGDIFVEIINDDYSCPYQQTYVAATYAYLRIREASGTIYFDYSADGSSWTNAYSLANPFAVTELEADLMGYNFSTANITTFILDDFNVLPSAPSGYGQVIIISD